MSEGGNISYMPTDGLSYDPADEVYWDPEMLRKEVTRIFEVCHGCRMCFKFCDSFPDLFRFVDDHHDGDVTRLTEPEIQQVMDACFQCKLCEVQCPYTPRDGHEFQLDYPKLVHRWQAQKTRQRGSRLRDRLLGNQHRLASLARATFGLANALNRTRPQRLLMEKLFGIHRDAKLPDFADESFEDWARRRGRLSSEPGGEVVVFQTCFVNNNQPQLGRDSLEVFERNGIDARCTGGLDCCGMPHWEFGHLEPMQAQARRNLDVLEPWVDAGAKVAVLQPTCAMMLRREYPDLVAPEDRERARKVADAVVDPGELVWSIRREERYNTDFKSSPEGIVAYHAPCHLRAQGVGFRGRDLLRKLPGVERITSTLECSGHDGTYALRVEGYEPSIRIGQKSFVGLAESDAALWVTDCSLAAQQFEQHAGRRALHPMTVLAMAYRGDSFTDPALLGTAPPGAIGSDSPCLLEDKESST